MSHFTVTVRLTAARLRRGPDIKAALDEILAPYDEASENPRFSAFVDEEDEMRADYARKSTEYIRTPEGELLLPFDERFRVAGTFGIGGITHTPPPEFERVEMPFSTTYPTFAAYAKDWCGRGLDPKTGRYGYWHKPNAKWDWWVIGGRWAGYYPLVAGVKPIVGESGAFDNQPEAGHGDIVRVRDIDMAAVARAEMKAADKFWGEWQRFLAGGKSKGGPSDVPRSRALDIGLLDVVKEPIPVPAPGTRVFPWTDLGVDDERRSWSDVAKIVTRDEFYREYMCFFDELASYAGLDDDGWVEPGAMGWFGVSGATPNARREYYAWFRKRFIDACGPEDLLVLIDGHI